MTHIPVQNEDEVSDELAVNVLKLAEDAGRAMDKVIFERIKDEPPHVLTLGERIMSKTRGLRWRIAKWFAPDIHEYCD